VECVDSGYFVTCIPQRNHLFDKFLSCQRIKHQDLDCRRRHAADNLLMNHARHCRGFAGTGDREHACVIATGMVDDCLLLFGWCGHSWYISPYTVVYKVVLSCVHRHTQAMFPTQTHQPISQHTLLAQEQSELVDCCPAFQCCMEPLVRIGTQASITARLWATALSVYMA